MAAQREELAASDTHVARHSNEDTAYEYLCRLEEAKKWIELVISESLPPAAELEDSLQSGVILCKVGMKLLPSEPMWKRIYDLDHSKFKSKGVEYRHTDNINFWLTSLQKLGLSKVFYPDVGDIFNKRNMPKVICCIHALSHLLKKKGKVSQAVDDLYGSSTLKFSHNELAQTSQTLKKLHSRDMPAFGMVENLVEEELQYEAMGLCDSYEEEMPPLMKPPEHLFDDPKYLSREEAQTHGLQNGASDTVANDDPITSMPCICQDFTVKLYLRKNWDKRNTDKKSPLEAAVSHINEVFKKEEAQETFKVIQSYQSDGYFPFMYQGKNNSKYHTALMREKEEGLPPNLLPVFYGINRETCDDLLEKMSPGAYIVRCSHSIAEAFVFSFRNQTGIKHWKLSSKNGMYFWGNSSLHPSLDSFVEHFSEALSLVTKLYTYCGMTTALQPVIQTSEHQSVIDSYRESDSELTYGQICKVIKEVSSEIRQGRKSFTDPVFPSANGRQWNDLMIVNVNRLDAEAILHKEGEPGSFLVRPSERTVGDYALVFRTKREIRHWKIIQNEGKFYVHPRPNPYTNLEDIIVHFQEAVGQETGMVMKPLANPPSLVARSTGTQSESGLDTLRVTPCTSPLRNSAAFPTLSLSKLNPANLTSWSVDDVCHWLVQQSLGKFIDIFKENQVDGECLLSLDNDLLKNDLGIAALGHRSRILKRVQTLKDQVHPQLQS